MKTLATLFGGKLVITENEGVVSFTEGFSAGGGKTAGILAGGATETLNAYQGLLAGQALLNSHLSAAILPLAQGVETIVDAAVTAAE